MSNVHISVGTQLIEQSSPAKIYVLSIQLKDENWFLSLCYYTVISAVTGGLQPLGTPVFHVFSHCWHSRTL
jgi:hypothetical protein